MKLRSLVVRLLLVVVLIACTANLQAQTQQIAGRQTFTFGDRTLEWQGATISRPGNDGAPVSLLTSRGRIAARFHPANTGTTSLGVIWLSGAGGGLDGPARRSYAEAAERLQGRGIASLRLDYRKPQDLHGCVLDTLCGAALLGRLGVTRIVLVGHSFGGGVAVAAASTTPNIKAVVALSSQTAGAVQMAPMLDGRALLVVHGGRDKVLPVANAREIFAAARNPKELRIFPDAGHNLTTARNELIELLLRWIPAQLSRTSS
jgi:pimeloyl-ACP methyl ester carboxylesterase